MLQTDRHNRTVIRDPHGFRWAVCRTERCGSRMLVTVCPPNVLHSRHDMLVSDEGLRAMSLAAVVGLEVTGRDATMGSTHTGTVVEVGRRCFGMTWPNLLVRCGDRERWLEAWSVVSTA